MNVENVSLSRRWDSAAIVSNTSDDFPEPETPVKTVILRRGMSTEMFLRLFSRAPRTWMVPKRSDSEDEGDMGLRNSGGMIERKVVTSPDQRCPTGVLGAPGWGVAVTAVSWRGCV